MIPNTILNKEAFLGKSFLTLKDFSPEDIISLVDLAEDLRKRKKAGQRPTGCEGKNIALIFEKTSTRTRCSFNLS